MLDEPISLDTGFSQPLTLRKLSTADAAAFAEQVVADLDHVGEHLPWPERTTTPEGAAEWLGAYERGDDGRVLVAGVWNGGQLLGGSLLLHYDEGFANIEIGCWVVSAAEGKGVASAACLALMELARREMGVERIEWCAVTGNTRSRRLAEKLGFKYEGTRRSDYVLRGERLSTDILSLVGEEIDQAVARG